MLLSRVDVSSFSAIDTGQSNLHRDNVESGLVASLSALALSLPSEAVPGPAQSSRISPVDGPGQQNPIANDDFYEAIKDAVLSATRGSRELADALQRALSTAIVEQRPDVMLYVLNKGANPNRLCPNLSVLPLHLTAQIGHAECLDLLLAHGAKPDALGVFGETALHHAMRSPSPDVLIKLAGLGVSIHARDVDQVSPLNMASALGKMEHVKVCLALAKAQPQANPTTGAAQRQWVRVPNTRESVSLTPADRGHVWVLNQIQRSFVQQADQQQLLQVTLCNAILLSQLDFCRYLLCAGAQADRPDGLGRYPMHLAAASGHADLIELMLKRFVNQGGNKHSLLGQQDVKGFSALHHAAQHKQWDVCRLLLKFGVNAQLRDLQGRRAIDLVPCHLNPIPTGQAG